MMKHVKSVLRIDSVASEEEGRRIAAGDIETAAADASSRPGAEFVAGPMFQRESSQTEETPPQQQQEVAAEYYGDLISATVVEEADLVEAEPVTAFEVKLRQQRQRGLALMGCLLLAVVVTAIGVGVGLGMTRPPVGEAVVSFPEGSSSTTGTTGGVAVPPPSLPQEEEAQPPTPQPTAYPHCEAESSTAANCLASSADPDNSGACTKCIGEAANSLVQGVSCSQIAGVMCPALDSCTACRPCRSEVELFVECTYENVGCPGFDCVPSPMWTYPVGENACASQASSYLECLDADSTANGPACVGCLNDAVPELSGEVPCPLFEKRVCPALKESCTSCGSCADEIAMFYDCLVLAGGCSSGLGCLASTPASSTPNPSMSTLSPTSVPKAPWDR